MRRALGADVWGRRVARLPDRGILIAATDLQGNLTDYEALKRIHQRELAAGTEAILVLQGDLVHGPSPDLTAPGAWPDYLGTPYVDRSADLIRDFEVYTRTQPAFCLLGNHEHAHVGGPIVSKFYEDEAEILNRALGGDRPRILEFIESFPLLAVSRAGFVLSHGAPAATEPDLDAFEKLVYRGFESISIQWMYQQGTVGGLLWARHAEAEQARSLLKATSLDGEPNGFVAFGHDVVREGYETQGKEQICFSTSYGLHDHRKVYLRLDLSKRYRSVKDLHEDAEILLLYP